MAAEAETEETGLLMDTRLLGDTGGEMEMSGDTDEGYTVGGVFSTRSVQSNHGNQSSTTPAPSSTASPTPGQRTTPRAVTTRVVTTVPGDTERWNTSSPAVPGYRDGARDNVTGGYVTESSPGGYTPGGNVTAWSVTPGVRFIPPTRGSGIDWTSNAMTAVLVVATAGTFVLCVFLAAGVMHCYKKCRRQTSHPTGSDIINAFGSGENYAIPYSSSERRLLGYTRTALDSPTGSGSGSWGRKPTKPRPQVHKHLPYCSSLTRVAPYDAQPRPVQYRHTPQADIVRAHVAASRRPRSKTRGEWRSLPDCAPLTPLRLTTPSPDYENLQDVHQDFPKPVPPNLARDVELCTLQNAANGMQENRGRWGGDGVKLHPPPRLPHQQGNPSIELQSLHITFGGDPRSENFQSDC